MLNPALTSRLTPEELNTFITKINKQLQKVPIHTLPNPCAISNMAHSTIIDRIFNLQLKYYVQDVEAKKAAATVLVEMKNSKS